MHPHAVEFIGGPLDGLTQRFTGPPGRLPRRTGLPINPALLRFLFTDRPLESVRGAATSIALYRLDADGPAPRYRHLGSVAAEQYELENA